MKWFNKDKASLIGIHAFILLSSFGMHFYFLYSDAYFTEAWGDSFKQIAHYYPYIQREFSEGNFFWSWSNGLGGDLFGGLSYYYSTSPFFWLLMLFPSIDSLTDIFEARLYISIAKLFISMVLMFHLLRYLKLLKTSSLVGSLIYGGSVFFTFYSFRYDFMIDGMMYLPLIILALEWTIDHKKPWFLIGAVFITVCGNFYLAFINSIFLGMYSILKYFCINEKFTINSFVKYMFRFIWMYATGLLLACFAFLPAVYSLFNVDRFYFKENIPLLFSSEFYSLMPYELFFSTNLNYQLAIAYPIVVFLLFPLGFLFKESINRKRFMFALFILLLVLIPFTYSFFNGLSAMQYRWLYLFIFTVAMTSAFVVDQLIKGEMSKRIVMTVLVCLMIILAIGLYFKNQIIGVNVTNFDWLIFAWAILSGIVLILLSVIKKNSYRKILSSLLLVILLVNCVFNNNQMFETFINTISTTPLKQTQENLLQTYANESQQEMINQIQKEDNSFYRILWDQSREINAPMLLNYKGFGVYSSLVEKNIHRYMKVNYNTLHQNAPSMYVNLDNRLYQETVLANKYYIKPSNSQYTPYGYTLKFKNDEFEVYENNYALPIGFLYNYVVDQESLESLTYGQRDALLLQAAVVKDAEETGLPIMSEEELTCEEKEISLKNLELNNAEWIEGNQIYVEEQGTISFANPWKGQRGEMLIEFNISESSKRPFKVGYSYKVFQNGGEDSLYNYPRQRIAINLVNQFEKDRIDLWLGEGTYKLSDIIVTFNSYEEYARRAEGKQQNVLENISYSGRSVHGTITAKESSIMFLSIPYSSGWKVKVDGKVVEPLEVNTAFIGIPISAGKHNIELTYVTPYFVIGSVISLCTLLAIIIYTFIKRRAV